MFNIKFPPINLWSFPKKSKEKVYFRADPLSVNVRFYKEKVNISKNIIDIHDEWYKIITCQFTDTGEVYFSGVKEGITRAEYLVLFKYFKEKGYKSGYYRHKHKEFYVDFTRKNFNLTSI